MPWHQKPGVVMKYDPSARVLAGVLTLALLSFSCTSDEASTDAGPSPDAASDAEGPVPLKMYTTCGDPVCSGPRANPGVSMCGAADVEGAVCKIEGARCDLGNQCNQLLVCARKDPKTQPGGCPIALTGP
jgi:hypothetical protein